MRGNKKISTLLLLLEHIIIDIMPFTVVTAVFILTFGYALALLSDRTAGTGMYNAASVDGFLVKVYLTLLGEFQYEDDPTVAKLLVFVSFSFISNIVLLNALIAIITHSYDEGREHEAENRSLLLATVILETEANVERNEINFPSWVHVLRKNVEVGDFDGEPSSTTENLAFAVDSTHTSRRLLRRQGRISRGRRRSDALDDAQLDLAGGDGGTPFNEPLPAHDGGQKVRSELREIKTKLSLISHNVFSQLRHRTSGGGGGGITASEDMGRARAMSTICQSGRKTGSIAIDMGTGEIKLIALLYRTSSPGESEVIVKELATTKEIQKSTRTVDLALSYVAAARRARSSTAARRYTNMTDPDGDAAAHDMELVDEVIDQLKEGLKKLKPELQGPHDKRDPLFEGDEYVWDAGIIGSTAWYRKLHRPAQESVHEFLCKIKEEIESFALDLNVNIDLKIELISEHQEAMYEQRAVEYACARMGLPLPAATISAGSGSMQFSSTPLNLVASIQMSLAEGEDLVKQENDRAWKQRVKVSFDACEEVHAKYVNYHSTYSSAVKLAAGTLNQRSPTKQATSPLLRSGSSAAEFYLVGISGLYYAAKAAKNADGVSLTKAHNGEYINVVEVLQAFEVLEANVNETPKNRANAMRVRVVLNAFLELTGLTGFYANYAKIMFLRDVRTPPFDERSPFRTTWTSGWWIERLKSHGVSLGTK